MSHVWAIADLHLSLSCPQKDMAVFGSVWKDYQNKLESNWRQLVSPQDWVLIPGDITWAMKFDQALQDLSWIEKLPGKKIISKGNHDYWWPTAGKLKSAGFSSITNAQQQLVEINSHTAVVGCKFFDSPEYSFDEIIDWNPSRGRPENNIDLETFEKELIRLKQALELFKPYHTKRIAMIHYPPVGLENRATRASELLEAYNVDICVFGHLHSLKPGSAIFENQRPVQYIFCASDYIGFKPLKLFSIES